jgi:alpha-tubulin suppressor-like RCC1 family protein
MSKKFLTRQNNNTTEYGVQVRDDNPNTLIDNQPYYNKTTKQLKVKTPSNNFVLAETQRALQLDIMTNLIPIKDGDIFTVDAADLTPTDKINRSTVFDGDLYAEVDYTQPTQSLSISMWIKFDDAISDHFIFSYPKNVVDSFNLKITSGSFELTKNSETATYAFALDSLWHHLVASYDETNGIKLYLDGDLVASASADGALAASGLLSIGSTDGSASFFTGSIANLQVWSKELTDEALLLYKRGYSQDLSFVTGFDSDDLEANYGMGDGNRYFLEINETTNVKKQLLIENSTKTPVITTFPDEIDHISIAGGGHSLALKADGRVFAWGSGTTGILGDNTTVSKSSPVQVVGQSDFVAIAGSDAHSLALKADGRVFTWGTGGEGQLGDNTIVSKSSPVQVVGQSDFVAISAGGAHSLALKTDGRVYAWGDGTSGILGDNTIVSKSSPVQVVGQSDFVAIFAGGAHSLALKADGRVFTWGTGGEGQLGDNTIVSKSSPVQVVGQSDFVAISAGDQHSLALKADGRVFVWGNNGNGQLGDNTIVSKSSPVQVVGQSDFVAIAAGAAHSLALKADGRVFAWGLGSSGILGDNTTVDKSSPVQVVGQSDFVAIAAGEFHSLALKADGRVFAWGVGGSGRLGDNTIVSKSSPVMITGYQPILISYFLDDTKDSINAIVNSNEKALQEISINNKEITITRETFKENTPVGLLDETNNNNTLDFQKTPDYSLDLPTAPGIAVSSVFDNTVYLTTNLTQTFSPSFSFSAWIKFDPSDTTQQVFKVGNFELYVTGTSIVLKKGTIISGTATFDLSNPANQGWNHFVATWFFNGPATGEIFLFRNGVQIIGSTSLNNDGGFGNSISGTFDLGANTSDANFRFLGKIANAEIWSTQLTVANAASLHAAGYYTNPASIIVSGLVHNYLMGDGVLDVYDIITDQRGTSNLEAVDGLIEFDKNDLP